MIFRSNVSVDVNVGQKVTKGNSANQTTPPRSIQKRPPVLLLHRPIQGVYFPKVTSRMEMGNKGRVEKLFRNQPTAAQSNFSPIFSPSQFPKKTSPTVRIKGWEVREDIITRYLDHNSHIFCMSIKRDSHVTKEGVDWKWNQCLLSIHRTSAASRKRFSTFSFFLCWQCNTLGSEKRSQRDIHQNSILHLMA